MEIIDKNGELKVSYSWRSCSSYIVLVFAVFVNLIMVYGVINLPLADDSRWILWSFYFPFFIFLYFSIAKITNKTTLLISGQKLKVRIGPLPWLGNKIFDIRDMSQFYVKKKTSTSYMNHRRIVQITYVLYVVLINEKHKKVIGGLAIPDVETAQVLEKKIEQHLGIENKNVDGEFKGHS